MIYIIQDRQAGNKISSFATLEEAKATLAEYEEEDKMNGEFECYN